MLTVVIATTGRPESLKNTLQSLAACEAPSCPLTVFVIVNGNDVISLKVAESFSTILPLRPTFLKEFGKNRAINTILGQITKGLVLFTDDDIRFDKKWLISWEPYSQSPESLRILCGPIGLDVDSAIKQKLDEMNLSEDFLFSKTAIFKNEPISAELCWGGNLAIPAEIFNQGHRFNQKIGPNGSPNYRMGSEVEFCIRLERAGFQCHSISEAKVFHRVRPDQLTDAWISKRYFRAGRSAFLFRQYDQKANSLPYDIFKGLFFLKLKIILKRGYSGEKEQRNQKNTYAFLKGQVYEYFFSLLSARRT